MTREPQSGTKMTLETHKVTNLLQPSSCLLGVSILCNGPLKGVLAWLRDGKELAASGPSGPELYRCLKAPCYVIYAI